MSNYNNGKLFVFNDEINEQSMQDLYGDDYHYIEEVFETVLKEYQLLYTNITAAYALQDTAALKAAVHKIKPIFGFTGLLLVQQQCQQFENICQSAPTFELVMNDFGSLKNSLIKSKALIEDEKKKLEIFNNQRA